MRPGLEGVVVAETRLSHVDGEAGRLILKGYDVESVAGKMTFEQMAAHFLAEGPEEARALIGSTKAGDIFRRFRDRPPTDDELKAFDTYLVTVIDHGMNASTFAARVVASTGADLAACITAAKCALSGPLHGGAPGPALEMLEAIGSAERARSWIESELDAGRRIMGLGHRIYRVRDPRAAVLEKACELIDARHLSLVRVVEREAEAALAKRKPDRPLKANVELYTAVLLDALGFDRARFTEVFASSRVVGWCAHVAEQRKLGRLIRPDSIYVGDRPALGPA
jgi:citrate synthase